MLDSIMYLSTHSDDIEELYIGLGKESSVNVIKDCCMLNPYKRLSIGYYNTEQRKKFSKEIRSFIRDEKITNILSLNESFIDDINNFHAEYEKYAVIVNCIKDADIIERILKTKPHYFVMDYLKGELNSFAIWETWRKTISHFYLCSYEPNHRNEVLLWDKNPESDIELSVVFPVYNVGPYLEKCIESIIQWQADYVEYLFVNDGSPDNSAEIISQYAKKDSRIKLLSKENGGCASARQYGMERARGRYIGFIDPDDYIDPSMFQKLFSRAMSGSYEIAYCGFNEVYEELGETKAIDDLMGWPYYEGTVDKSSIDELIAFRRVAIWRGIYSKEMIKRGKIHFYTDIRRFDDLPFKVETLAVAKSVVCVPEYLYYYRMSRPGQDVSADDERLYVHFLIFNYLDQFINRKKEKAQIEYLQVVKLQTHQWALCKIQPKFLPEYLKRAKIDMLSNVTKKESAKIAKKYTTRRDRIFNYAICHNNRWLVSYMINRKPSTNKKLEKQVNMLHEMAQVKKTSSI